MPTKVALSTLNASTIDIINTIRANASAEYQSKVPAVTDAKMIPRVGEVICGTPAFANDFVNALVNRIALVTVKSATFNNAYAMLKKGYLQFGETVEEVFVAMAKAQEFSAEKAEQREFKRTIPDVRTAFHTINWKVMYPVTVSQEELEQAFLSMDGVQDLIAKIVNSTLLAAEYDEFLLFKYLLIKAASHGKMYPVAIGDTITDAAVKFRGTSNKMTFIRSEFNEAGVHTNSSKAAQHIFMDADYNAQYDVGVLAAAFNMDKAEFSGKLQLIDDFTTFDNERWAAIRENCDCVEEVTAEELELMAGVKAILVDGEWFQVYDNKMLYKEREVASGLYWNYFLHSWKTVSHSPFSNAVVFVSSVVSAPTSFTVKVESVDTSDIATVVTLSDPNTSALGYGNPVYVQIDTATTAGIAIHKYGAVMFPTGQTSTTLEATINGVGYTATTALETTTEVGTTITFNKNA